MPTKQAVRNLYLAKRQELSPDTYAELNGQLLSQSEQLNFTGINCIHCYLPITAKKEPDTILLINRIKQTHPNIKWVYPKTNFADHSMRHYLDDEALVVQTNSFGIPEPIAGIEVNVVEIDMVIVPLLAFDKRGYRVGYGKGFYDRFLIQCKPATQFIGLSFFDPVDTIDDIDSHDIRLDQCITPTKVWDF